MKNYTYPLLFLCLIITACTDKKNQGAPGDVTENDSTTAAPVAQDVPIRTPDGYEVMGDTLGDLDKDNIEERVIVYNTNRQTDMGSERELHIYKQNDKGWERWHQSTGPVMPSENGGVMGDPFQGISIENGSLVINHFGGSRQKWAYTHRYRYQNETWQLIGATVNNGAPCDYFEDFDFNLSTGKIIYKKTIEDCETSEDNPVTKTQEKTFTHKLKTLPSMDGFHPGENEISFPKTDITFYY